MDFGAQLTLADLRVDMPPAWPDSVLVAQSERRGGVSQGAYESLNLGLHVGDDPARVLENRRRLEVLLPSGTQITWLRQVHGIEVVKAAPGDFDVPAADACWTPDVGVACAIMTADCLPVLLTTNNGSVVAAAHAGWRGLAAGVLEHTVAAMGAAPDTLHAWLGPSIGPRAFEVGAEVREAFLEAASSGTSDEVARCFRYGDTPGKFIADLPGLAEQRLRCLGLRHISRDGRCTVRQKSTFYSHRRDGVSGRMASLILRMQS